MPSIAFSQLLVENKTVVPGEHSFLKKILDATHSLELSHQENIFSIQYAALDYTEPADIQYAYMLEGFEKDWNYVGKQRVATYTNLPQGDYVFKVRSTNSDGQWTDNVRSLSIKVLPSFWETPIAYFLYILFVLLFIVTAVYILFTIYRLKHKVSIEQQLTNMKLRFFTDISHELRTPLTLISGPVEYVLTNKNLPDDAREQLQVVERNTKRMLHLVNQILDFRKIQNNKMKLLLNMPVISKKVKQKICEQVQAVFGGNAYEVVVGGAALNQEIESFLTGIEFPITTGYGATECAPLITFSDHSDFVPGSCGTPVAHMEVKILSPDPENVPGEIVARGTNVMLGYYKNEEATAEALDSEGWYHTGDLATMSKDGHVFIRGRIKNMLLGANGQNVYPEEIEDKLNSMTLVGESLVLQKGDKLIALVHPNMEEAQAMGFNQEDLQSIMEQNRLEINALMPAYCKLSAIKLHDEEFEKTPKKSIKRYLYKNIDL